MTYTFDDIYVIIVVYNMNCEDSAAFNSLAQSQVKNVMICDNSTKENNNEEACEKHGFHYIDMGGNMGLSKAYNRAIEQIPKSGKIICLFDDDTDIHSYFDKVLAYLNKNEADIYVPIVTDEMGILSPCIATKNDFKRFKNTDEMTSSVHSISAINSGMAIRSEIFENYRYDELLFLEHIDHDFMRTMRAEHKTVCIMKDIVMVQHFALFNSTREQAEVRFKILKRDYKRYYRNASKFDFAFVMLLRRLVYCKEYKTPKFLFD